MKKQILELCLILDRDDIENGGEGAPLAPLFHDYIFNKLDTKRAIVNIGGISNISFLDKINNLVWL